MSRRRFMKVADTRLVCPVPRDQRLPQFTGLRKDAHAVLNGLSIGVVGAGSVGLNYLTAMATLQIKKLLVVDPGCFKPQSLLTHRVPPSAARNGGAKARIAAKICHEISPATECSYFPGPVEDLELSAFLDVDLVVLATDNLAAEKDVSQRCLHLGIPLLQCAVHGETLVAQVRFCSNQQADGPCLCCSYNSEEREHLAARTRFSCLGGLGDREIEVPRAPTMSTAATCSLAADLGATMTLRHALSLGSPLQDCQVEFCGYTNTSSTTPLRHSDRCLCDHTRWQIVQSPSPLAQTSLGELLDLTGYGAASPWQISIAPSGHVFVEIGVCQSGHWQRIRRFGQQGRSWGKCKRCGRLLYAHPFFAHESVPATAVGDLLGRSLRRLGVHGTQSVLTRCDSAATLVVQPSNIFVGSSQP